MNLHDMPDEQPIRRVPPHSREAEEAVIGGIFVHPRVFADVNGEVNPEDFYHPALRAIDEAFVELDRAGKPIDPLTTWEQMRGLGTFDKLRAFGGADYFTTLMGGVVTIENIAYHARTVARLAERRIFAETFAELQAKAYDDRLGSDRYFEDVEAELLKLMQQRRTSTKLVSVRDGIKAVSKALEERERRRRENIPQAGIRIGIEDFDAISGGLQPGQLIILAARPGVGKSALMGNIVDEVGTTQAPALIFSCEMLAPELYERMIAAGGVNANSLRHGTMSTKDWIQINKVAGRLVDKGRIWVDDSDTLSIAELRSRARRWRAAEGKGETALVCVDYLQLVHGTRSGKSDKREQEVAEVSRGLKALAKELKCPVIALAQINRAVEARAEKRPTLADLRESGQIEADADIVAFVYRDDVANPKSQNKGKAELIIAKGRGMPIGTVELLFDAQYVRFRSVTAEQQSNFNAPPPREPPPDWRDDS